jgi:nucleotide-binding universal stress UspA family protein
VTGVPAVAGRRIVVGVDGSAASKQALRWAQTQAALTGATLTAVMTWNIPTAAYGAPLPSSMDLDLGADAEQVLDAAISDALGADAGATVGRSVQNSYPAPALLAASEGAELLVVGSRGHGEFVGMLLGSVAQHCVGHAVCPVVVVPPTGSEP